jgi:hypothetical protein
VIPFTASFLPVLEFLKHYLSEKPTIPSGQIILSVRVRFHLMPHVVKVKKLIWIILNKHFQLFDKLSDIRTIGFP